MMNESGKVDFTKARLCAYCKNVLGPWMRCTCEDELVKSRPDPRIFGTSKVGSEPVPQPPSKRFKGGVGTPHGDVSFHSEHEAARDCIWDAVSEKLDRDNGRTATVNNKGPHQWPN